MIAWPDVSQGFDTFVNVTDGAAEEAMRLLYIDGVVSGDSGAAGLAGLLEHSGVLNLDQDRLWNSLAELGEIGAYRDEDTGLRGVCRLALTDEDVADRSLVLGWMRDVGLRLRRDEIGNVYARRDGEDNALRLVLVGSHIDSVATAGRFDGCLGVLGGLEVVRTLNDHDITTKRPLELAIFTEEEGVRFGTDMLGSAVAVGQHRTVQRAGHRRPPQPRRRRHGPLDRRPPTSPRWKRQRVSRSQRVRRQERRRSTFRNKCRT